MGAAKAVHLFLCTEKIVQIRAFRREQYFANADPVKDVIVQVNRFRIPGLLGAFVRKFGQTKFIIFIVVHRA
jgi:hypothetical protein